MWGFEHLADHPFHLSFVVSWTDPLPPFRLFFFNLFLSALLDLAL